MRDEIAKPAASSFAELIRLPVDSRSIAVDIILSFDFNAFCVSSAFAFVLITVILPPQGFEKAEEEETPEPAPTPEDIAGADAAASSVLPTPY